MRVHEPFRTRMISQGERRSLLPHYIIPGCFAVLLFVGCASVETQTHKKYLGGEPLVKPDKLLIYDFAFTRDQVQLDEGIGKDLTKLVKGREGIPKRELELEVGRKVANALSANLVNELGAYGILAERATRTPSTTENVLMVKGQFVSIDEGNSTQRMVVGFGLGRSIVRAQGQVYQMTPQGKRHIGGFDSEVKSGRKPGMGPMVGAGAVMGNMAVSAGVSGALGVASETSDSLPFSASLEANVKKMAKELANKAAKRYVREGWLPPQVLK